MKLMKRDAFQIVIAIIAIMFVIVVSCTLPDPTPVYAPDDVETTTTMTTTTTTAITTTTTSVTTVSTTTSEMTTTTATTYDFKD